MVLLLALLLICPQAHAGHWQGRTNPPAPPSYPGSYPDPVYACTASASGGASAPILGPNSVYGVGGNAGSSITFSGTASCQWTWVPAYTGEPPPSQVILTEGLSSVMLKYWSATLSPAPPVRYKVMDSSSGTINETLPVSATVTFQGSNSFCSLLVSATVSISSVFVNIIGTNSPSIGDNRALTGQQITAYLTTDYGLPRGTKVTGYTWSLSGGTPIKGWDPNAPSDGQPTQILPLLPTDYGGFPPIGSSTVSVTPISFYDEFDKDAVTVKCTATLSLPDYSTPTLNAVSPQVTFLKPSVTKWDVATGYVQQAFDLRTGNLQTANYGYGLAPVPGSQQKGGEAWNNVTISVPAPFYGGQGCFAQLVTPNATVTNDDSTKSFVFPGSGQTGLDNAFPYRNYTWYVPALGANIDGPAFIFSGAYNKTAYQGYNTVAEHDKFSTWVMYKPPTVVSQGTIWVPLQSYSWDWAFTSVWNGQWPLTTASPMTAADDPHYKPTGLVDTPPQWGMIQNNSN